MNETSETLPPTNVLKEKYNQLQTLLGEPGRQPLDYSGPLYISDNFDGRHASGFSNLAIILPSEVGMSDEKYKTGRPGYLGKPSMDVCIVRPYQPGQIQDYHLEQNPDLGSEDGNTTYAVLSSNYYTKGDERGVVTKSWVLRNDGKLQTWEKWGKWEQVDGWGGNVITSKQIPNDPENNLDLWSKVVSATEAYVQSNQ